MIPAAAVPSDWSALASHFVVIHHAQDAIPLT
jgi:hypothetical protein